MGSQISPLGWILIILLALTVLSLNISLFTKLKKKDKTPGWISSVQSLTRSAKDPFHDENTRMQELAETVEKLKIKRNEKSNLINGDKSSGESK